MTLIQADIDYCCTIWASCPNIYLNKVQRLQNRAARILCNVYDRHVSSASLLKFLRIMNIKQRQQYLLCILMFKCLNGLAPICLVNRIHFVNETHCHETRASAQQLLVVPKPKCESFRQSFYYLGPLTWNSLPFEIRSCENIVTFKLMLKNYILGNAS